MVPGVFHVGATQTCLCLLTALIARHHQHHCCNCIVHSQAHHRAPCMVPSSHTHEEGYIIIVCTRRPQCKMCTADHQGCVELYLGTFTSPHGIHVIVAHARAEALCCVCGVHSSGSSLPAITSCQALVTPDNTTNQQLCYGGVWQCCVDTLN